MPQLNDWFTYVEGQLRSKDYEIARLTDTVRDLSVRLAAVERTNGACVVCRVCVCVCVCVCVFVYKICIGFQF